MRSFRLRLRNHLGYAIWFMRLPAAVKHSKIEAIEKVRPGQNAGAEYFEKRKGAYNDGKYTYTT